MMLNEEFPPGLFLLLGLNKQRSKCMRPYANFIYRDGKGISLEIIQNVCYMTSGGAEENSQQRKTLKMSQGE